MTRLHNEELHILYCSPNIVRMIKCRKLSLAGHVVRMEEGKPTGKIPLGRSRRRWQGNIRMDLKEVAINTGNWVYSAQNRDYLRALVYGALNLRYNCH